MTHAHSHVKNEHIHTNTFTGHYTFRGHSFYFSASDMDTQLGYLVPTFSGVNSTLLPQLQF